MGLSVGEHATPRGIVELDCAGYRRLLVPLSPRDVVGQASTTVRFPPLRPVTPQRITAWFYVDEAGTILRIVPTDPKVPSWVLRPGFSTNIGLTLKIAWNEPQAWVAGRPWTIGEPEG